jgi:hypothetical protein
MIATCGCHNTHEILRNIKVDTLIVLSQKSPIVQMQGKLQCKDIGV